MTNFHSVPLLRDTDHLHEYADTYHVPTDDIQMIALNASGVDVGTEGYDRGRFKATSLDTGRTYFTALTTTDEPLSPFRLDGNVVSLGDDALFETTDLVPDTCTDTYWRNGYKGLTINTNSRANCHGCMFCGTYSLENDESPPLLTLEALEQKAKELATECPTGDLSELERIGVVTGCFASERKLADHLKLLREAFGKYGFDGTIQYVGSQLRSSEIIHELVADGEFALFVTLEAFTRRTMLMKKLKSSLTLDLARNVMGEAKAAGAETNFLYIAGLDPLPDMEREFPTFADVLTRAPQIQTFQAYTPNQLILRDCEAGSMDYFLKTRGVVEQAYPNLPPTPAHNFRSLWFTAYRGIELADTANTIETK